MKSHIRLISIISGAAVVLAIIIFLIVNAINAASTQMKPISIEDALLYYEQAKEQLSAVADYRLAITTVKNTSVDSNIYSVTKEQALTYNDFGTEQMQALLEETVIIGRKQTAVTETFSDNTLRFTVNESAFSSEMTAEAFVARFTPAAAVDMSLYNTVKAEKNKDSVFVELENPTAPESWCLPEGAQMRTGSGTILLDGQGHLKKTTYNIEYQHGAATVNLSFAVEVEILADPVIEVPKTEYTPVSVSSAPMTLEAIYSYLLQADNISATATESINCQASGIKREQKTTLNILSASSDLNASFDSRVDITDYNNAGNTTVNTQMETFRDNAYSISTDGGKTFQQNNVTAQQMLSYCQDLLVKNLILPEYIASVTLTEQENSYTLQIVATEALAQVMCQNACQILYDDPQLLSNLASSYKTQKMTCFYTFDKYTELPVAAGLDYSGEHTIEGFAYTLNYLANITYGPGMPLPEPEAIESTETVDSTTTNETNDAT